MIEQFDLTTSLITAGSITAIVGALWKTLQSRNNVLIKSYEETIEYERTRNKMYRADIKRLNANILKTVVDISKRRILNGDGDRMIDNVDTLCRKR